MDTKIQNMNGIHVLLENINRLYERKNVIMKLCYIVYREEEVMVFQSQVLEYLQELKGRKIFEEIELVVFRHEKNICNKKKVEDRVLKFVDKCVTFATFPVLSMIQLDFSVKRLRQHVKNHYNTEDQIAVICRGDLAGYVGSKAFLGIQNSRILFDNRGLAYEESEMSNENNLIYKINRNIKRNAMIFAKDHCDMYNFVTNSMRDYMIDRYNYNDKLPYTVIPTLYRAENVDSEKMEKILRLENYHSDQFVVCYAGAVQVWQSTDQLIDIIEAISVKIPNSRFIFLMNGKLPGFDKLSPCIQRKITIKSVPHNQIKYYLQMADVGVVMRSDNIVNRVAAPTKIAEYLTSGVQLLYSGNIGIINDLKNISDDLEMIEIDSNGEWLKHISKMQHEHKANKTIVDYFDMKIRQKETVEMICNSFKYQKNLGGKKNG